jgi:hypothetical protein
MMMPLLEMKGEEEAVEVVGLGRTAQLTQGAAVEAVEVHI